MAKTGKSNSSNYSYNILSNRENLEDAKKKIIDKIKVDLFETMNMDNIMVDRNNLAHSIDENRKNSGKGRPYGKIKLNDHFPEKEIDEKKYADILTKYDNIIKDKQDKDLPDNDPIFNEELRELDTQLAERIILDQGCAIEFKSIDKFKDGKSAEEEAELAYKNLNKLKDYDGKIDLASKTTKDKELSYFVIKRKPGQRAIIKAALEAINAVSEIDGQEIAKLQNDNKEKDQTIEELKKKLVDIQEGGKKMKYKERQIQLYEQVNAILKVQLQQMEANKGGTVMVEGNELKVTDELKDSTKEQIKKNDRAIERLKGENNEGGNTNSNEGGEQGTIKPETPESEREKERIEIINILGQILQSINNNNTGDVNIQNAINNAVQQLQISLENSNSSDNSGNNINIENNIENIQMLYSVLYSLLTIINNNYANISNVNMGMFPMFHPNMMSCVQMLTPYMYGFPYCMGHINGGNINGGNINGGNVNGGNVNGGNNVNINAPTNEAMTQLINQIQTLISQMGRQGNGQGSGGITNNPTFTNSPTANPQFNPTANPQFNPTANPQFNPTANPQFNPTNSPQFNPTANPQFNPTFNPTFNPQFNPTNSIDNSNVNMQMMALLQLMINQMQQINNNGATTTLPEDGGDGTSPDGPIDVSTDDPADTSTDDPVDVSTDDATDTSTDDATDTSTDDATDTSTDDPVDVSTDGPIDVSTDGPIDVSTDGPQIEQRERVATISNVRQINRAIAQREADEELRERFENAGWNIFERGNLFLRRKFIKDRLVHEKLGGTRGFDWSEAGQSAADRHQIEQQNNFAERMTVVIQDIDSDNYPETRRRMDELLGRLTGRPDTVPPRQRAISDGQFQTEFQNILDMSGRVFDTARPNTATNPNWRPINEIIRSNRIDQLSTNILMQANKFREQQALTRSIFDHIARDPGESDANFDTWCRGVVKNYIDRYNDIPDFLHQMGVNLDDQDATREIRRLQANDNALYMISAQSLRMRIQLLDDGGEAYTVKKEGGLFTKIGRFLDDPTGGEHTRFGRWMNDHPGLKEAFGWIWGAAKVGAMVTPSFLLAPFGPLAVAGGVGGMSFLTTLFKKKAHFEREGRSYKRMQATNLSDYRAKRDQLANEVAGMRRYQGRFWGEKARVRRQYRDYVLTSQDQLSLSNDLLNRIQYRLQDQTPLTNTERTNFAADIADGLARLDYHRRTGENFLGSDNPNVAEREYRALQNAVMGGLRRLGFIDANGDPDANAFRTAAPFDAYYNNTVNLIENGTGDEYNTQGYLQARKKFKRRSNAKAIDGALRAGAISFGLSYLMSSLASRDKTEIIETETEMHNGKVGGEFNPGDSAEELLIPGSSPTGSVYPEMGSYINSSTSRLTNVQVYSSVDAIPCSAAKGAGELAMANSNLTADLGYFASNPDVLTATSNYISDVTTKVSLIPGLDAGNHDLIIARAIESYRTGILKPLIDSGNTAVAVNPTGITRVNAGAQASGVGTVSQTFRNMGLIGIDYVQKGTEEVVKHVTRAIPIPIGINTFGSPKSDPRRNTGQRQGQGQRNNGQGTANNGQRIRSGQGNNGQRTYNRQGPANNGQVVR